MPEGLRTDEQNIALTEKHLHRLRTMIADFEPAANDNWLPTDIVALSVMQRIVVTTTSSLAAVKGHDWVSAAILTRATAEATALLWVYGSKFLTFAESKDDAPLSAFVERVLRGTRVELPGMAQSVNVLTLVDKADRDIPFFRKLYDYLSEAAHPNSIGLLVGLSDISVARVPSTSASRESTRRLIHRVVLPCLRVCAARSVEAASAVRVTRAFLRVSISMKEVERIAERLSSDLASESALGDDS